MNKLQELRKNFPTHRKILSLEVEWVVFFAYIVVFLSALQGVFSNSVKNISFIVLVLAAFLAKKSIGRGDLKDAWIVTIIAGVDLFFRSIVDDFEGIGYTINIIRLAIFCFIAPLILGSSKNFLKNSLVLFCWTLIFSEIYLYFDPSFFSHEHRIPVSIESLGLIYFRPVGFFGDPNYYAIPFSILLIINFDERKYKWALLLFLIILLIGSRGAVVGAIVGCVMACLKGRRSREFLFLTVPVVVATLFMQENLSNIRGDTSDSNAERWGLLLSGIDVLAEGIFLKNAYGAMVVRGLDGSLMVVHNTWMQTILTSVTLFCFFVYRLLRIGISIGGLRPELLGLFAILNLVDIGAYPIFFMYFSLMTCTNSWCLRKA